MCPLLRVWKSRRFKYSLVIWVCSLENELWRASAWWISWGRVHVCMRVGPPCVLPQIAFIVLHMNSTTRLKSYVWLLVHSSMWKYVYSIILPPWHAMYVCIHPKPVIFPGKVNICKRKKKSSSIRINPFCVCDSQAFTALIQRLAHFVAGLNNKQKQDNRFSGLSVLSELSMGSFAFSRHLQSVLAARRS